MNTHHLLKCWPEYFEAVYSNRKRFELRRDDRNYQVGDVLCLMEWNPVTEKFTGRECERTIGYVLRGASIVGRPDYGVREGFVILSLTMP